MIRLPLINRFTCNKKQLHFCINEFKNKGINTIIGYINENPSEFKHNFLENRKVINSYKNNIIALKMSSLNINNDYYGALEKSKELCELAINNNNKIVIDAEYNSIQDDIIKITDILIEQFNKKEVSVFKTYQMYRNDHFDIFKHDLTKNKDYKIGFKLVRGAYYNEEKNNNWINKTKHQTDYNYNVSISLFNKYNQKNKLICATHNETSIDYALSLKNEDIHYAQLMGMSDRLTERIKSKSVVYKYISYGDLQDTVPYLIRRLYENLDFSKYIFR